MPQAIRVVDRLADQGDVTINSPSTNQVLTYNGTKWGNAAAPAALPSGGAPPLALDTFSRADNATSLGNAELGGAWVLNGGTMGVIAGEANFPGTGAACVALVDAGAADVWIEAKLLHDYSDLAFRSNSAGTDYLALQMHSGLAGYYYAGPSGGMGGQPRTDILPAPGDVIAVMCYGNSLVTYVNGVPFNASATSNTTAPRKTNTYFGFRGFAGGFVSRWDNFAVRRLDPHPQILFDGDSLTHGDGPASPDNGFPEQVIKSLGKVDGWEWIYQNAAIFGDLATTRLALAPARIDAYYNSTHRKNVCSIWVGTNDLNNTGGTPANVYATLQTYWAQRRRTGWKVMAYTFLPRSDASKVARWETDRQALNTLIRSNPTLYDALVDVGADATIGQAGQSTNTTYYVDGLHPTIAGYAIIAGLVRTALATL